MFPVSDVIPPRVAPVVTIGLIVASVAAALAGASTAGGHDSRIERLALSPLLHAGWLHLAANVLALWIFGSTVEDAMGRMAYLAFYALAGLVTTAAHAFAAGTTAPPPGAAGPVAAIIAAYFVLYPRSRVLLAVFAIAPFEVVEIPALYVLGLWVIVQALAMLSPPGSTPVGATALAPLAPALAFGALAGLWLKRRARWE